MDHCAHIAGIERREIIRQTNSMFRKFEQKLEISINAEKSSKFRKLQQKFGMPEIQTKF